MKAEIISIGNELTSGSVPNTNATFIAGHLFSSGIEVSGMLTVGDESAAIIEALRNVSPSVSFVVVTGGLGPTVDDITTRAAAEALRRKLTLNHQARQALEEFLNRIGRPLDPHNLRQAYLPVGAAVIPNPIGTACGFSLARGRTVFFFLPGVPREMTRMFEESVMPQIRRERPDNTMVRAAVLKIFGRTESYCDQALHDLIKQEQEIAFAFLPHYPEITIKLTIRGTDEKYLKKKLKTVERKTGRILGNIIFGHDEETLEMVVGNLLRKAGATLAVAESCTGGLITHRITNVPGSSEYLERTLIVYGNRAKKELMEMPASLLAKHGAVSKEAADHMARAVRRLSKSTIGLAVTGIAGPGGGTPEKPVGTVFIALAHKRRVTTHRHQFHGDREQIKHITSQYALDYLRRLLMSGDFAG
jgi:nicotinamide-nucleotide amidase